MKATNWEFKNRALVFGLIFAFTFPLYAFDHVNAASALADWLGAVFQANADVVVRILFAIAAGLVVLAASIRTWASSYLQAEVVYASQVQAEILVADGPYRRVRNPLYFANVLLAAGMGAMMCRSGFILAVLAMVVFCYRLILREEAELQLSQGVLYQSYLRAVPRLLPSLRPRIPSSGRRAHWSEALKAENWYWGFAAGLVSFAFTLSFKLFWLILVASIVSLWAFTSWLAKKK